MSESNPFKEPLLRLFEYLNVIYGTVFHLETQLRTFARTAQSTLEEANPTDAPRVGAASSLAIMDLTEWPEDGWARRYISGGFASTNEEYIKMSSELLSRYAAWAVVQGWERFTSFLLDALATYLVAKPQSAEAKYLARQAEPSSFPEWRSFVKKNYRGSDNRSRLEYLRRLAPHLVTAEERNNRGILLPSWYKAAAKVRHAVTHSDSVVLQDELVTLDASEFSALQRHFPGRPETGGYLLTLTSDSAREALVVFAEYGFSIFKAASMPLDYDWNILNEGKPIVMRGVEVPPANSTLNRTPDGAG